MKRIFRPDRLIFDRTDWNNLNTRFVTNFNLSYTTLVHSRTLAAFLCIFCNSRARYLDVLFPHLLSDLCNLTGFYAQLCIHLRIYQKNPISGNNIFTEIRMFEFLIWRYQPRSNENVKKVSNQQLLVKSLSLQRNSSVGGIAGDL